jgi:hypothetical protein
MSEIHETVRALEARIAELERQAAPRVPLHRRRPRLSTRRVALLGLMMALLLPGIAFAGHQFIDVPNTNQFHDDIDWLADYGITTGYGDFTFRPGQTVTRQATAAFLHRLSNEFEVIRSYDLNPTLATEFSHSASCPGDKRAIGGGGYADANILMTKSYPLGGSWVVFWRTDNGTTVDPSELTVWVLCAPRS